MVCPVHNILNMTDEPSKERSGTIQYIKNGRSVWETHPMEKSRLIYQIGSSDPDLALQAAKVIQEDVYVEWQILLLEIAETCLRVQIWH